MFEDLAGLNIKIIITRYSNNVTTILYVTIAHSLRVDWSALYSDLL